MPVTTGPTKIYYETRGEAGAEPALFICGFTAQLLGWREAFCRQFVERGVRVILFDNRDAGLSQKFGGPGDTDGGYGLGDMAADGFAVLDALGLERAHVVGQSMGGMIGQVMALAHPERVGSLSLIYSSPSIEPRYFVARETVDAVQAGTQLDRGAAIEAFIERERISGSSAYAFDEAWIRELAALCYDRCYAPDGALRQRAAMARWDGRAADLERLSMPACVIHGRADGHIKPEASVSLAAALRNAELHLYPGLGHELAAPLWDEFATIITRTMRRG